MPKRILFFPEGERYLDEISPVINQLAADEDFEVHLLVTDEPIQIEKKIDPNKRYCILDRVKVHQRPSTSEFYKNSITKIENIVYSLCGRNTLSEFILNTWLFVSLFFILDYLRLIATKKVTTRLFNEIKPDAYAICRDRNLGISTAFLRLCRKKNVISFLIPWGYMNTAFLVSNRKETLRNHLRGSQVSSIQLLQRMFHSKHIYTFEGNTYSYYKPGCYLAALAAGICPTNPWFYGSDVDVCMADSLATKKTLSSNNVPAEKIYVTGNQIHDTLYVTPEQKKEIRKTYTDKYNLTGKPILMIAVPHLAEHKLLSWEDHWTETKYLLSTCQQFENSEILLSLHPRSDPEKYRFLEEEFNAKILEEPLKTALNIADQFICLWSGVTVWSVMKNIPTLVLHYLGIPSFGYEFIFPYIIITDKKDNLSQDVACLLEQQSSDKNSPDELPPLDGKSTKRVIDLIKQNMKTV